MTFFTFASEKSNYIRGFSAYFDKLTNQVCQVEQVHTVLFKTLYQFPSFFKQLVEGRCLLMNSQGQVYQRFTAVFPCKETLTFSISHQNAQYESNQSRNVYCIARMCMIQAKQGPTCKYITPWCCQWSKFQRVPEVLMPSNREYTLLSYFWTERQPTPVCIFDLLPRNTASPIFPHRVITFDNDQ